MELSARYIHEKQFNDAWRGYNQEEVDEFLDRVAEAIEHLRRENDSLHARVRELDQAVAASRDTEEMLKKTLLTAQQAAEEAIARAKAKADELIAVAEERARTTEDEARRRVALAAEEARRKSSEEEARLTQRRRELDERIEKLRGLETETKVRLRTFFEQQLNALDALAEGVPPRPPRPVRRAAEPLRPASVPEKRPEEQEVSPESVDRREETAGRGIRDLFFRQQG